MEATDFYDAMNVEGINNMYLNDIIESGKIIYSGNLPSIYWSMEKKFTET